MFGELVRAHRRRLGMTQEELAGRTGLSVRGIGKLEGGRAAPRMPTVRLLADAFDLSGPERDLFCAAADPAAGSRQHGDGRDPGTAADSTARPLPAQLPADAGVFTGRVAELATLSAAVDEAGAGATVVIFALGGSGGIGKTWLAVHWAHRHLGRFPDGQLFVNLRGFDPSGQPLTAMEALGGFLDALGVPARSVPADLAARVGLYRSLVAGRRMLVVLDNARDTAQITDLLPGSGDSVVLVTSRSRLTGLVSAHGAHPVPVDVLDDVQAEALLRRRLGGRRLTAEPDAVARILAACGGLPLALGLVAARAALAPRQALAAIADELGDTATRLRALDDEAHTGLGAALSWSYAALTASQATVFCLLGLAPGPDIGLPAAAALTGLSTDEVSQILSSLERQSLTAQPSTGRWRMHDLVRLYCVEQGRRTLAAPVRHAALRRLVAFYLHTAYAADRLLEPLRAPITQAGPVEQDPLVLPDEAAAWAWLDREHPNVMATQRACHEQGWDDSAWQLAWALNTYHTRRGPLVDKLQSWRIGADAALRAGQLSNRSVAHRELGRCQVSQERYADGADEFRQALALAEQAGDLEAQAEAHLFIATVWERWRADYEQALRHVTQALRLAETLGDEALQARALNAVGWCSARLDRFDEARPHLDAALVLARRLRHPIEGATLDSLGHLASRVGDHELALKHHREAVAVTRRHGDTYLEIEQLASLGTAFLAVGQPEQARQTWRAAVELCQERCLLAAAERIRRRLDELDHTATV